VVNPRGTEPINVKSMFEVFTGPLAAHFEAETVRRTPWTRRFFERSTTGPGGETIGDLVEWTRRNWSNLVLKPERGYSGIGVKVGGEGPQADEAVAQALAAGNYIVQAKVDLAMWAENIPEIDHGSRAVHLQRRQTDFRCLVGPQKTFGFLCRYGDVPTNVGSGGGVQPLAILQSGQSVAEAVDQINCALAALSYTDLKAIEDAQKALAMEAKFTYLLGPIKIALRPRIITPGQLRDLTAYGRAMWNDSLKLEQMWQDGQLDDYIDIEAEELEIARLQPWQGGPAIFAADGLFGFGAEPEDS
jgi:hypothetical protein